MTYQYKSGVGNDVSKITISTWVFIPSEAMKATATAAGAAKENHQNPAAMARLPIMEFGRNADPHVAFISGHRFDWEGTLGIFNYSCSAPGGPNVAPEPPPSLPSAKGYFYVNMPGRKWVQTGAFGRRWITGGTGGGGAGGSLDPNIPGYIAEWTQPFVIFSGPGISSEYGIGGGPLYGYSESGFGQMDPSKTVDSSGCIGTSYGDRFDLTIIKDKETTAGGNYTDQGYGHFESQFQSAGCRVVLPFGENENVTYDDENPSAVSALVLDQGILKFIMFGKWPGDPRYSDSSFLPRITFNLASLQIGGWNHIFIAIDLTTAEIGGGTQSPRPPDAEPWFGPPIDTQPRLLAAPTCSCVVNGQGTSVGAEGQFPIMTPYGNNFKMALSGGAIGLPVVPSEVKRYKTAGKNQLLRYAYTQVWLEKFINPGGTWEDTSKKGEPPVTRKNIEAFYRKDPKTGRPGPPPHDQLFKAQELFGKSQIYFLLDKAEGSKDAKYKWTENQGTLGNFSVVGTEPKDYYPGPGQDPKKDVKVAG